MTRCGIVTVAGRPNVGKSTLMNRLVGQKLAITSQKPQSTRDRVTGIVVRGDTQIVLADTPGLLDPRYPLQHAMRATSIQAIHDADVVLYLVDATSPVETSLADAAGLAREPQGTIIRLLTKADLVDAATRAQLEHRFPDAVFVSAVSGDGLETLLERLCATLPESPFLFDADDASAQPVRFFVAELIRETVLELLNEEVPYAIACQVEEFREDRRPVYIRAVLYVERDSQKRIVIGQGGRQIREIGRVARLKIEDLVQAAVYLDLWVKVLQNWRRDPAALRRLGFSVPEEVDT
jgi:GTP-binding protein Era